jgi:alpha-tubulin suppressor-like RCC1 family protein
MNGNLNFSTAISSGFSHSLLVSNNGILFVIGDGGSAALGMGDTSPRTTPTANGLTQIKGVAAGQGHSVAIDTKGSMYVWGGNLNCQLGFGVCNGTLIYRPTWNNAAVNGSQVCAGSFFTMYIANQKLFGFGTNSAGQLGMAAITTITTPTLNPWISGNVESITCGGSHSLVLRSDGILVSFGDNSAGQLGIGTFTASNIPTTILTFGTVRKISAGLAHSFYLNTAGDLYAFGDNTYAQLGVGSNFTARKTPTKVIFEKKVIDINTRYYHSCLISDDNKYYCFGLNYASQLATGMLKSNPFQRLYLISFMRKQG